uniref:Uncharacterized protein n=1 Tax=Photinus pyralis TaxID=7054 RepID=A0A1Y1MMI8_PHOPY
MQQLIIERASPDHFRQDLIQATGVHPRRPVVAFMSLTDNSGACVCFSLQASAMRYSPAIGGLHISTTLHPQHPALPYGQPSQCLSKTFSFPMPQDEDPQESLTGALRHRSEVCPRT